MLWRHQRIKVQSAELEVWMTPCLTSDELSLPFIFVKFVHLKVLTPLYTTVCYLFPKADDLTNVVKLLELLLLFWNSRTGS